MSSANVTSSISLACSSEEKKGMMMRLGARHRASLCRENISACSLSTDVAKSTTTHLLLCAMHAEIWELCFLLRCCCCCWSPFSAVRHLRQRLVLCRWWGERSEQQEARCRVKGSHKASHAQPPTMSPSFYAAASAIAIHKIIQEMKRAFVSPHITIHSPRFRCSSAFMMIATRLCTVTTTTSSGVSLRQRTRWR